MKTLYTTKCFQCVTHSYEEAFLHWSYEYVQSGLVQNQPEKAREKEKKRKKNQISTELDKDANNNREVYLHI